VPDRPDACLDADGVDNAIEAWNARLAAELDMEAFPIVTLEPPRRSLETQALLEQAAIPDPSFFREEE
jgi:hypothetical protein